MTTPSDQKFSVDLILRLACAAQRANGKYIKDGDAGAVYADDGKMVGYTYTNKDLVRAMLLPNSYEAMKEYKPPLLNVTQADVELVEDIRKYFKRLLFSVIEGENDFQTTINALLNTDECNLSYLGFLVCLPSVYDRDSAKTRVKRTLKDCEAGVIGAVDDTVADLDAEIIEVKKSKNFDAHNVIAIVDNKIVSWMTSKPPTVGPAVIVKARVKGFNENWLTKLPETRLNYVKVAQ